MYVDNLRKKSYLENVKFTNVCTGYLYMYVKVESVAAFESIVEANLHQHFFLQTKFCSCIVSNFYPVNFNFEDVTNEGNKDCPIDAQLSVVI